MFIYAFVLNVYIWISCMFIYAFVLAGIRREFPSYAKLSYKLELYTT